MGDTQYVPWKDGGNGGTVSQVTVLGDWDEELELGEWWVVSQGSNGEGGKKGKKRKREKEGGTFRVPGELLFRTPPPRVQRMPCPTNTSVRTVFFEDQNNYVLNYVPGFRIEVSG